MTNVFITRHISLFTKAISFTTNSFVFNKNNCIVKTYNVPIMVRFSRVVYIRKARILVLILNLIYSGVSTTYAVTPFKCNIVIL